MFSILETTTLTYRLGTFGHDETPFSCKIFFFNPIIDYLPLFRENADFEITSPEMMSDNSQLDTSMALYLSFYHYESTMIAYYIF